MKHTTGPIFACALIVVAAILVLPGAATPACANAPRSGNDPAPGSMPASGNASRPGSAPNSAYLPVSGSVPASGRLPTLEAVRKEALLGFDSQFWKEYEPIRQALHAGEPEQAVPLFQQMIVKHPDSVWLNGRLAGTLGAVRKFPQALLANQRAIKIAESRGEHYFDLYLWRTLAFAELNDRREEASVLEKMQMLFPHSRADLASRLVGVYRRLGDQKKMAQALTESQRPRSSSRPEALLFSIKPTGKDHLPPGWAYEIIARSRYFQRFKYTTNGIYGIGGTGVIEYVSMPSNYGQLLIVSPESHNRYNLPVDKILPEYKRERSPQPVYSKVSELGPVMLGPVPCLQYMCQCQDESRYDLVTVMRDLVVAPGLLRVQAIMNDVPFTSCMVLSVSRVVGGCPEPILQTFFLKKVKFDENACKEKANYHLVRSQDELMMAGEGALKKEDLDMIGR